MNSVMIWLSILLLACLQSKEATAGIISTTDNYFWIKSIFPVSIHGCQLKDNMEISGGINLETQYVRTTEECAKICSQTRSCDSFWCFTHDPAKVSGGVTKSCNLRKNGGYRKANYKTAGICSKGGLLHCFRHFSNICCSFSDSKDN